MNTPETTTTTVRKRPILFSGPMVRAILDGSKTQTRRVVKNPERLGCLTNSDCCSCNCENLIDTLCPYGVVGDRLWVRETWGYIVGNGRRVVYRADGAPRDAHYGNTIPEMKWRASIHMPRGFSRIALEVTGVRVERLQAITEDDAIEEGLEPIIEDGALDGYGEWARPRCIDAREQFRDLWNQINGKRAPWESNPWVWVIEFKREVPA